MSTVSRLRRMWTALIAIAVASSAPMAAAQTFTVTVPDRSPGLPVASLRLTIDMSGDPTGSTLAIAGSAGGPLALLPGNQVVTTGFGTDFVQFRRVGVTNTIEIRLTLNSNMNAPGNYCVASGAATWPQNRAMTLTPPGGVTATGYRFSSSSALSTFECTCVTRRIQTTPPTVATSPSVSNLGRNPLDVVLVLDRSGSMSSAPIGGGDAKMAILKWAVGQFIDAWKLELGAPGQDRLAVVWFESTVTVGSGFVARSTVNGWDTIKGAVNGQSTANMTALGDGLSKAVDMWADDPQNDGAIVLMTNGMQNVGNQIRPGNEVGLGSPDMACFDINAGSYQLLRSECIPVQTIGVGAPSNYQQDLLDKIALQTGGSAGYNLGNTLDFSFGQALVNILKGNTMTTLSQVEDTLAAQAASSPPRTLDLDGSIRQGIVVLAWRNRDARLELQIRDPNGTLVTPASRADASLYTVQTVTLPATGPPGAWTVTVVRAGSPVTTPYHLSTYAVEGRLDFRPTFVRMDHRAGDPVELAVEVAQDGQPLTGLDGAITARAFAPPEAIGTALHNRVMAGDLLDSDPPGFNSEAPGSPGARYQRKLQRMVGEPGFLAGITPREDPTAITLRDDGTGADERANDGIYTGRLADSATPGQYIFDVAFEFDSATTGKLSRREKLETAVRVKADPGRSAMSASGAPGTTRTIEIEPVDRFGNFLGPGYGDFIHVVVTGGGSVTSVTDPSETGRYLVGLAGVAANTDPDVTILVDGERLYQGRVSRIGQSRGAVFFGLGANVPQGTFGNSYDGGFSLQAGAEVMLAPRVSIEGVFGFDQFGGSSSLDLMQLSARAKFYASTANPKVAVFVGGGAYFFDPGDTHGGTSVGGVAEFVVTPQWSVEVTYTLHNVATPTDPSRFSAVHGGFRFHF